MILLALVECNNCLGFSKVNYTLCVGMTPSGEEKDKMSSVTESYISENTDIEPVSKLAKRKKNLQGGPNKKSKWDQDTLPKTAKSNKNRSDLYRQPTADEINHLKETENLFNSNVFRLQIEELLGQVRVKEKQVKQFDEWYGQFCRHLECIEEYGDVRLDAADELASKKLKNIVTNSTEWLKLRFNETPRFRMKFDKPASVFSFGKHKFIPDRNRKYGVDIGVTISRYTFYEKDYLNARYMQKKIYYLFYLMQHVERFNGVTEVCLQHYLGNEWLPVLTVTPTYSDKVKVNIFVTAAGDTFKLNRFCPDKNNIKRNILTNEFSNYVVDPFAGLGTPLYNSVILHDLTLQLNQKVIEEELADLSNVTDGLKLLMVWLKQRNLGAHYTSITADTLIYMIVYLCTKKKINRHMSSYQVVRIFWSFLSTVNEEMYSICEEVKRDDLDSFKNVAALTLIDSTGYYNVATFLDFDLLSKLKRDAEAAIDALDDYKFKSFSTLFMTKMPHAVQYDVLVNVKSRSLGGLYDLSSEAEKFRYYGFYQLLACNRLKNCLKRGLGQRISHIVPTCVEKDIAFGINLNAERASSVIEKGPRQFDPDEEHFKEFWGSFAELRRFKDSSIYEAVYFQDAKSVQDKRLIFRTIIDHVLKQKLNVQYELYGTEMEKFIRLDMIRTSFPPGSNEEAVLKIRSLQNELGKMLRELKLPLAITGIQGISDAFSYTDVFPPVPTNHRPAKKIITSHNGNVLFKGDNVDIDIIPHLVVPLECVVQLAVHSKWPRDLNALRAMKKVYTFEIAKLLEQEPSVKTMVTDGHLDIFYKGLVFRMTLYHPKEVALLKENVDGEGVTFYKDNPESLAMERRFDLLPKVCGALNRMQQEHPAYGPGTCLAKRWLRSQLIDDFHISDTVVNLLNASLFLSPEPFGQPTLAHVAFVRFLKFVSEYDFCFNPVIVNFNNNLSSDELNEIENKAMQYGNAFMGMFIVTPYDQGLSAFTKNSPTKDVLRRIKCLAKETYTYLSDNVWEIKPQHYEALFVPNLEGYDLLIYIKTLLNPRRYQRLAVDNLRTVTFDDYDERATAKIPIINFNPVCIYLKELRENYGDYALFFHNTYGGNVIGVLWKRSVLQSVDFKVSTANARKTSVDQLQVNKDALIEDFYITGKGLVKTIEVQNK